MQGLDQKGFDPDQLLQEQHQWEKKNDDGAAKPANAKGATLPAGTTGHG